MKILYVKGNLIFKPKYRVNMIIYEQDGKKFVRKYALAKSAVNHLKNEPSNRQILESFLPSIGYPRILKMKKDYIEYEFLDIPSLEFLVEKALLNKNYHGVKKYLEIFIKLVNRIKKEKANPYNNKEFVNLFDKKRRFKIKEEDCIKLAVYDLNFNNILMDEKEKLFLIDYEWIFNFSLPRRFLFFRSIYYLAFDLQSLISTITSKDFVCYEIIKGFLVPKTWFDFFNFSQNEIKRYLYYMYNFQNEVNLIQHQFDEGIVLQEKKVIDYKYSQSLEHYFSNRISNRIDYLESENKILHGQLENIKSAKFFRLWQAYCRARKIIFRK